MFTNRTRVPRFARMCLVSVLPAFLPVAHVAAGPNDGEHLRACIEQSEAKPSEREGLPRDIAPGVLARVHVGSDLRYRILESDGFQFTMKNRRAPFDVSYADITQVDIRRSRPNTSIIVLSAVLGGVLAAAGANALDDIDTALDAPRRSRASTIPIALGGALVVGGIGAAIAYAAGTRYETVLPDVARGTEATAATVRR